MRDRVADTDGVADGDRFGCRRLACADSDGDDRGRVAGRVCPAGAGTVLTGPAGVICPVAESGLSQT